MSDHKQTKIERPLAVSELVLQQLRKDIIENKFHFGEKISEAQISEQYGVTKAPVRAAYIRLESEGLIDIKPQSGTFVFNPTLKVVAALCELRTALESEAIKLAYERNPQQLSNELNKICQEMQVAQDSNNTISYQYLDARWHKTIVHLADSPLLKQTYLAQVHGRFSAMRYRLSENLVNRTDSFSDHVKISKAIAGNRFTDAREMLIRHVEYSDRHYRSIIEIIT